MKLYAVTLKAKLVINGAVYAERAQPVSKYVHLPQQDREHIPYAPAVFTARANAVKLINKMPKPFRDKYTIVEFDSGWEDYPEPR